MPKMKTRKAVAKRVKITARGKVKVGKTGTGHLRSVKSPKARRQSRRRRMLSKSFVNVVKAGLGL
jgi:large subunit ribosomal protein L35